MEIRSIRPSNAIPAIIIRGVFNVYQLKLSCNIYHI